MSYLTELKYIKATKDGVVVLTEPLTFRAGEDASGVHVVVPKGFSTNLTSVPKILQWLYPADGPYAPAAVVHDYLYRRGKVSRKAADVMFYDALKVLKVSLFTRLGFYAYVRLNGWRVYPTGMK